MNFTWDQLTAAAIVVGAIIAAYNVLSTALKNYRENKKVKDAPMESVNSAIANHTDMLNRDKRRIDALEKNDERLEEGLYCLMRSNLAMNRHMLHGNNIDGLNASEREITDFLTKKVAQHDE